MKPSSTWALSRHRYAVAAFRSFIPVLTFAGSFGSPPAATQPSGLPSEAWAGCAPKCRRDVGSSEGSLWTNARPISHRTGQKRSCMNNGHLVIAPFAYAKGVFIFGLSFVIPRFVIRCRLIRKINPTQTVTITFLSSH